MTTKIRVPQMGESVVEATVGEWLKKEGDTVAVGDLLVVLETDKVDVEVGAETAGVLAKIEKQQGEDVAVGDTLGLIEAGGQPSADGRQAGQAAPARKEEPAAATRPEAPPQPPAEEKERVTPVARRLAQEQGVDLAQVPGRGAGGRITKQDVQEYLEQQTAEPPTEKAPEQPVVAPPVAEPAPARPAPEPATAPAPAAQPTAGRREERLRMSRRRRTIARRLVEAQHNAAMLTTFNEVDMSAVMGLRKRRQETFQQRHGIKLGFMSFFVKASIGALKAFPQLNAEIDGDDMILKQYYDIGIAVGVEEGLVVPVLRDADRMTFAGIEQAIKEFADKAREGTLSLEDLRGGTFTITNGGVFGSLLSTPILNPPQVGILGLHKIEERPVALNGEVVIRPMMYLALSYDHRIVDGREAVQFLVRIKELIEDPEQLLLEG
ncbi:MAG: 2-oxoglutarate dehydrogenase complex dihydrolipoyllysine-residue succinyltransferase [Chloroflexi bacterium]|nr:2-oxoglutarate dehydrogenase complex dihydrolipoyllysine-residue succinyltransferase [Chloroflexota bacterium]MCI0575653.1 2-oxoglutarate dehydrogenase complex dihydrolipoyllysine-residue succinyltransferase [Chloroflexota bacterium]MCI0644721.1 2-oxoglutarate dehydrogenase complex dihydrolipoyllysine-residue succinyltransferase [Chloroflexota bacterium]